MDRWLTLLGVALITALFVALHLRARGAPRAPTRECPRCRTRIPEGASHCPACEAPLQAFDLVTAPLAKVEASAASDGPLHAVVRADACAGCGTCVDACPEPGAIRLVDKVARVDTALCKGHAKCVAACPVGAIFVTSGDAVQVLEVPDLNEHFESRQVRGLYVVGELGGRGLIKNAVNEGKLAMEHVAESVRRVPSTDPGTYDVVVVGAGPAGLSAGLEAIEQKLRYAVLEQGTSADTISHYPRHKILFAEPVRVPLYGDLWVADGSKESLLQIWQNIIQRTGLRIQSGCRVEAIVREAETFVLSSGDLRLRARRVVLALGRRGTPRRLGVAGEELAKVFYDIVEMEAFAGRRVLVVGGGDSAVESAVGLSHQPQTEVTLSYRGQAFDRVKERNRAKLEEAVRSGRVRQLLDSEVREIRADSVSIRVGDATHVLPNDDVVIRIGGEAPYPFLERCGVRIVKKALSVTGEPGARMAG